MAYVGLYFSRMFQRVFMANRLIIGQWGYVRKTDFPCILKLLGVEDDGRLACVLRSLANGVLMFVFGLQSSDKAWVTEFLQDWLTESAIPPIYSLLFSVNAIKSFFDGYGYHGTSFEQTYLCYPASFIDKPQIENGDKIIMPPSALDRLASLHIDYPMLFELHNAATERMSHCGVLEFIAEEGMIYMPYWMMENLLLQEGDIVRVKNVTLPKGTYVKLQPHTKDFLDISNPKAILETTLRNFSCLTTGDSIMVAYNNKKYYIDIIETKSSNAISIIETDCEVDFAPPLDYKEPEKPVVTVPSGKAPAGGEEVPAETEPKFNPFTGAGRRLDGKPLKYKPPPVSSSSGSKDKRPDVASGGGQPSTGSSSQGTTRQTQGKLVFGSNVNRTKEPQKEPAKEPKQEEPSKKDEPKFQPFTGKKYSLKG